MGFRLSRIWMAKTLKPVRDCAKALKTIPKNFTNVYFTAQKEQLGVWFISSVHWVPAFIKNTVWQKE